MLIRLLTLAVSTLVAIPAAHAAGFKVTISPGASDVPLAIPRTMGSSDAAGTVWSVAKRDLELSGYFEVLNPDAFIEQGKGIAPGTFSFDDWTHVKTEVLVKTALVEGADCGPSPDLLCVDTYVYYVVSGETLLEKRFRGPAKEKRALGHAVANAVLKVVTGQPGFFGSQLVAVGNQGGNKEVFVMDLDGKRVRPVTRNGSINLSPAFSPTGSHLAWTSYKRGNPDLYVKNLASGRVRTLSNQPGINASPAFSPDGKMVALVRSSDGDSDIFLVDAQTGKELKQVTSGGGIDVSPDFSPDGRYLAYASERSSGSQIYVYDLKTGEHRRVTYTGDFNTDPKFSPDGTSLCFVGRHPGTFDVFVVNLDGTRLIPITERMGDNEDPIWSPDGRYLVFSSTRTGRSELWLSTADGRHQQQLTRTGGWTQPGWVP